MIESTGDILSFPCGPFEHIVIPTNALGIMGAGLAKKAADLYPGLEREYKLYINEFSNMAHLPIILPNYLNIVLFPTKYSWRENSSIFLIKKNLEFIKHNWMYGSVYYFPEIGCVLGNLEWKEVYSIFLEVFADTEWEGTIRIIHPLETKRRETMPVIASVSEVVLEMNTIQDYQSSNIVSIGTVYFGSPDDFISGIELHSKPNLNWKLNDKIVEYIGGKPAFELIDKVSRAATTVKSKIASPWAGRTFRVTDTNVTEIVENEEKDKIAS